jgi:hypothetical protein
MENLQGLVGEDLESTWMEIEDAIENGKQDALYECEQEWDLEDGEGYVVFNGLHVGTQSDHPEAPEGESDPITTMADLAEYVKKAIELGWEDLYVFMSFDIAESEEAYDNGDYIPNGWEVDEVDVYDRDLV